MLVRTIALVSGLALVGTNPPALDRVGHDVGRWRSCRLQQLKLTIGPSLSEKTGQHTLVLVLTNREQNACLLDGYPTVALIDRRGAIVPFSIRHGGDQMVTSRLPTRVPVRPSRSAFVVFNKYRCDRRDLRFPRQLRLDLSTSNRPAYLSVGIPAWVHIGYCGNGDPGSTVTVSPFEPTLAAALRH